MTVLIHQNQVVLVVYMTLERCFQNIYKNEMLVCHRRLGG